MPGCRMCTSHAPHSAERIARALLVAHHVPRAFCRRRTAHSVRPPSCLKPSHQASTRPAARPQGHAPRHAKAMFHLGIFHLPSSRVALGQSLLVFVVIQITDVPRPRLGPSRRQNPHPSFFESSSLVGSLYRPPVSQRTWRSACAQSDAPRYSMRSTLVALRSARVASRSARVAS